MRRLLWSVFLCAAVLQSDVALTAKNAEPLLPSLVQLIATPEKYDGKLVTVVGFLVIEHEGDSLYLHREDYENALLPNSIWVDTTKEMGKNKQSLSLKYVKITGTFKAGGDGLQQFIAGGLTKITSVEIWSDPAHPNALRNGR
jgi:hypothetical protein